MVAKEKMLQNASYFLRKCDVLQQNRHCFWNQLLKWVRNKSWIWFRRTVISVCFRYACINVSVESWAHLKCCVSRRRECYSTFIWSQIMLSGDGLTCCSSADHTRHNSWAVFRARGGDKGLGIFSGLPAPKRLRGQRPQGEVLTLASDWPVRGRFWPLIGRRGSCVSGAVTRLLDGLWLILSFWALHSSLLFTDEAFFASAVISLKKEWARGEGRAGHDTAGLCLFTALVHNASAYKTLKHLKLLLH